MPAKHLLDRVPPPALPTLITHSPSPSTLSLPHSPSPSTTTHHTLLQNVLLSGELPCHAKICDFGLAKIRQESATMTGNIGTVHWTAPEVLNNERYHFAADIYSLGMVMVEMVSGM